MDGIRLISGWRHAVARAGVVAAVAALAVTVGPVAAADPVGEAIFAANVTAGTQVAVRPDGTGLTTVACGGERSLGGAPRRIARVERVDGGSALVSRDEACGDPILLWAPGTAYSLGVPSWSPDGARVAVTAAHVGADGTMLEQGVYVVEVGACSGSCPVRLAVAFPMIPYPSDPSGYFAFSPSTPRFATDNRRVVYARTIDPLKDPQLGGIYLADLGLVGSTSTGTDHQIVIAGTHRYQYTPVFSPVPGSDLIAYAETTSTKGPYRNDLFVTTSAGATARSLTSRAANIVQLGNPTWSPDGQWIAYHAVANLGPYSIFKMRSDGSGKPVTVLSVSKTSYLVPAWRR